MNKLAKPGDTFPGGVPWKGSSFILCICSSSPLLRAIIVFFLEGSFKSSYRVRRFLGGLTVFVQPEVCD